MATIGADPSLRRGPRPPGPDIRNRRHIIALASLGLLVSGYNNFAVGLALIVVKSQYRLSPFGTGLIAAATLAGMLVGSLILGRLADLVGRRRALIIDLALVMVFALASSFVQDATELGVARLLLGVGVGAGYPIGSSFVADVSPDPVRGRLMTLAFSGWGVGAFSAALAGSVLIATTAATTSWRILLGLGALPALAAMVLVGLVGLPESPRWEQTRDLPRLAFSALATPAFRRLTLAALVPWFLMDVAVYGVGLFTPTLLSGLGFKQASQVALGTLLLSVFTLAGFVVAGVLIDRVGRRVLQVAGFIGMAGALVAVAAVGARPAPLVLLTLFGAFQLASNAGPNTMTWILPAEMFPTRLRATGQGAATAFSRLGAVLGVLALPVLKSDLGLAPTLALVAAVSVTGALATAALVGETRGRPLSD